MLWLWESFSGGQGRDVALGVFYWWTAEHDGVVELLVHEVVCVLGVGVFYSWTDERVVVVGVF